MNTITDNLISLEEARYALRMMKEHSFTVEESLETIDDFTNRVRTVNVAWLINYIIETRLTEMQKEVIRRCYFDSASVAQCAQELGISLRAVYSSREKAMNIIGSYIEPLMMYFTNLPKTDIVPLMAAHSLKILSATEDKTDSINNILKNIRNSQSVSVDSLSKATRIKKEDIQLIEKGKKSVSVENLERYSKAFGVKFTLEIKDGKGELLWQKH